MLLPGQWDLDVRVSSASKPNGSSASDQRMGDRPGYRQKALVAGAAGFLGIAIVRALVDRGWEVRGLIRDARKSFRIERAGGRAVVADLTDPVAVATACRGCDLLVHVAKASDEGPDEGGWAAKVRVEGCQNLVRAARQHGVKRLVVGSGYWVYADSPEIIREDSALDPRGESLINFRTEQAAMLREPQGNPEVIIVRPGMVYGNGSWFRPVVDAIQNGSYHYVGDGSNAWSFVSLEDAATGFAEVAESGRPGEVYNLVDGHPAKWREMGAFVADRLSRPHPAPMPFEDGVAAFGADVAYHLAARRACSSAKIEGLGWHPGTVDFRTGLARLLSSMTQAELRPE